MIGLDLAGAMGKYGTYRGGSEGDLGAAIGTDGFGDAIVDARLSGTGKHPTTPKAY